MRLFAHLFDNDLSSPGLLADLGNRISNITLTWELHGGLRSIELEWAGTLLDAYQFYTTHLGDRVIISDHLCDRPVGDGFITGIRLTPTGVAIVASGFWFRHYDSLYNFDTTIQDSQQGALSYPVSDTNQGAISYTDEGADKTFTDAGQDFTAWQTTSGLAVFRIETLNLNGSNSWGHLGAIVSATEIRVYKDAARTETGWNGADPDGLTPGSYAVRRSGAFIDDTQDFSAWETTSGGTEYEITVINSDDTVSWGFIGASSAGGNVMIYQDPFLVTPGFLGEDPSWKTPSSYEIILCYDYKTTSVIIKDVLDLEVDVVLGDYSDIDETDTVIGFWEPNIEEGGMYPGELIEKLASMSDGDNDQWNYWLENQAFSQGIPKLPRAYFEAQKNDGTFDWQVKRWMITGDSATAERNIQEMRNAVRAIYRDMEDDELKVEPDDGSWLTDADSISNYWRRETMINAGNSVPEIADQYARLYLDKFKDALFTRAFTVGSKDILDSAGTRWPLWTPIKMSSSYFKFVDLFPLISAMDKSWDRSLASQATVMEYNYENNTLRVVLDQEDDRLDAMLARISAFQ